MQTDQTRQTPCGSSASNFVLSFFASNSLPLLLLLQVLLVLLLTNQRFPFLSLSSFSTSSLSCLESSGFFLPLYCLSSDRSIFFLVSSPLSPSPFSRGLGLQVSAFRIHLHIRTRLVHSHKDGHYVESPANRLRHR